LRAHRALELRQRRADFERPNMCKPQVDGYEVKSTKRVLNSNSIDPKAKVTSLAPGKEYKFLITPQ
jgi:hypothetical protein